MSNLEPEMEKVARVSEAIEESCKVIRTSLNFLVQHYRVKRLMEGENNAPRSLSHLQEKLNYLKEISYLNQEQFEKVAEFFDRYEAISVEVQKQNPETDFSAVKVNDSNEQVSNLDQAITLYFRDYTQLALLLVRLKVNAF